MTKKQQPITIDLVTTAELAAKFGVTIIAVQKWHQRKQIVPVRFVGRSPLFAADTQRPRDRRFTAQKSDA